MNITNPTNFGVPGLTLTTANAEGTGNAVRTGASILAYDTTVATAVTSTASAGDTATAARRNHVHSGIAGAGTVVDNAIARFNGTTGASLQGYTSNSPTVSDAGVITLASGQLVFPATQAASAGATTLDDYEEGTWTGTILLGGGETGNEYTTQTCSYVKIGKMVTLWGEIQLSAKGTDTGNLTFGGIPFTVINVGSQDRSATGLFAGQCTFADAPFIYVIKGDTSIRAQQLTNAGGGSSLSNSNVASNSQFILNFSYGA